MGLNTNTLKLARSMHVSREVFTYTALYVYFVMAALVAAWMLFAVQSVPYSYGARSTCITSPKILPTLFSNTKNATFQIDRSTNVSIGDLPLYSHTLCASPTKAPSARAVYTSRETLFGINVFAKPIHITAGSYAIVSPIEPANKAVPVDKPLRFRLSKPDATFAYTVAANQHTGPCTKNGTELSCDISGLEFEHTHTYDIAIVRAFQSKTVDSPVKQTTTTLTPITITETSIAPGANVYDQPSQLTLQTDKPIKNLEQLHIISKDSAGAETEIKTKVSTKADEITAIFDKPLPRKAALEVQIDSLRATDDSGLSAPYRLAFTTSGGPKVTGTNIGKFSLPPGQSITVSLDQPLLASQDWSKLASLKVNSQTQAATFSVQNNRLIIDPSSDMPVCATIAISLTADVQSNYGVSGDSAWTYNSRVRCSTIFSIGTSVKGRAITAYRFGSGSNPVIYVGTIHGNEVSAKTVLDNWLNELESNPDSIPAGRSIVVIPVTNPDGYAANQRVNANNIDLNRNFPSNDWKSAVTVPGGTLLPTGGGTSALSEPESQALATYVQQQRPRVLLTYHAKASLIEANEAADSMTIANLYAKTSKYRAIAKSQNTVFNYDTTGALEDWMKDKLGLPALCIELSSQTGNEFSRNKAAMWAIAKL